MSWMLSDPAFVLWEQQHMAIIDYGICRHGGDSGDF